MIEETVDINTVVVRSRSALAARKSLQASALVEHAACIAYT